jgi:dihydrodipicolinate synthase/N-acetylneuraminate lyase
MRLVQHAQSCRRFARGTWRVVLAHFKPIADAADLPLIAFQYPLEAAAFRRGDAA